jgi:hypothetical protein
MADADRWLDRRDGELLIALLPQLSDHGRRTVERRCIAPWQRRVSWKRQRWERIMALAATYDSTDGRATARAIRSDIADPDNAAPHRRELAKAAREARGALLGYEALRKMLAGLGTYQHFGVPNPACDKDSVRGAARDDGTGEPSSEEPQAADG